MPFNKGDRTLIKICIGKNSEADVACQFPRFIRAIGSVEGAHGQDLLKILNTKLGLCRQTRAARLEDSQGH